MRSTTLVFSCLFLLAGCTSPPPVTKPDLVIRNAGDRLFLVSSPDAQHVTALDLHPDSTKTFSLVDGTLTSEVHRAPKAEGKTGRGRLLVTVPDYGRANVLRKHERENLVEVLTFDLPSLRERFRLSFEDSSSICDVALTPDGKNLVVAGLWKVTTYDLATGHPRAQWGLGWHSCGELTFSPDGKLAASVCHRDGENGGFHVWEVGTGRRVATLPRDFSGSVLHFFEDGRRLLTRSPDGSLDEKLETFKVPAAYRLFDVSTEEELARWEDEYAGSAVVTADESRLVWTTERRTVIASAPIPR